MNIFVYGDSIVKGNWDSSGGWANRIKNYLIKDAIRKDYKDYGHAINLGVDGDTINKLLRRFKNETKARVWPNIENAFIIAVGINDSMMLEDEYVYSAEEYEVGLKELLRQARRYGSKVVFVNLSPVDESMTDPVIGSSRNKGFTNSRVDEFNNVLQKFCEQNSLPLIDINSLFKKQDYKKLLADGVHPNSTGHEIIYNAILPIVQQWTS